MESTTRDFLIESLRQTENYYQNIINASHPYPCGICQKNVHNNQKGIMCSTCKHWIHIKCNGTTIEEYAKMMEENALLTDTEIDETQWICNKCLISNRAKNFPYGLQDDQEFLDIVNIESLKSLEYLPSYEITSKAHQIDSLNQHDIDENIINNINSRYYPAYEFLSLKDINSFNILHSNLNGLENKFENYQSFINCSKMDLDVLCISETTQKENIDFSLNVDLDGYHKPRILGSKSSRGGVAIFTKNNLNVTERKDLNIVDKSFEAIWVEIHND